MREMKTMADALSEAAERSARGGFYLISGSTLATVIMAIAAILVGNLLGPTLYGDYNLIIIVPQILLLFTDLGINTGMINFASNSRSVENKDLVHRILRHGMIFRIAAGAIVFFIALALPAFLSTNLINRPTLGFYVQIASISILFQVVFTTATSAFVGLDKTEYNAITQNVQAISKTIISVALVLIGFGLGGAVMGYVGGFVGGGIISGLIFIKLAKSREAEPGGSFRHTFKILTGYGWPIYVSALITGFLPLFSRVILSFFSTSSNIGNYTAAQNFLSLIAVVPLSLTTALLPAFSGLDSSTAEKIKLFFKRANKYTCLLIVPITAILLLFSKQVVQIVYFKGEYTIAWLYLSYNCLMYFLVIIGFLGLTSLFNGLGDTKATLRMTIIGIILFAILAPILTALYDVPGVIISSLISNAIATIYGGFVARRKFHVEFDVKASSKIYVVAGIAAIPSLLLVSLTNLSAPLMLLSGFVIFTLIYVTLVPLAGIIRPSELETITNVMNHVRPLRVIAGPLVKYEKRILNWRFRTSSSGAVS
jgi:O-antigen/teichoic acid export membrane protein